MRQEREAADHVSRTSPVRTPRPVWHVRSEMSEKGSDKGPWNLSLRAHPLVPVPSRSNGTPSAMKEVGSYKGADGEDATTTARTEADMLQILHSWIL